MEATVKRDQTNQLCAKGDHILSYKALPHVLNVKRATHAEEAIELFVLLVHLVASDKKIVLNALPDLFALMQLVPNFHHQLALQDRPVQKGQKLQQHVVLEIIVIQALQYVPNVKRVTFALVDLGTIVQLANTVIQAPVLVLRVLEVSTAKMVLKSPVSLDLIQTQTQ